MVFPLFPAILYQRLPQAVSPQFHHDQTKILGQNPQEEEKEMFAGRLRLTFPSFHTGDP